MKAWHIVVLDGWKEIENVVKFSAQESKEKFEELKAKYKETHPHYVVKRENY